MSNAPVKEIMNTNFVDLFRLMDEKVLRNEER